MRTTQNVKWTAKLGNDTYSSPAIAGGKVFIGTSDSTLHDPRFEQTGGGVLLCLDEATGRLLWRLVVPRLTTGRKSVDFDAMGLGICSSPAVDGDRAYVVTNRNDILCLDVNGMVNGNDGPFLDERHYTVPAGHPPVEPGPQDADIIWRFDMNSLPVFPHDAAASSVLVFGDVLFVGTANGVDNKKHPLPSAPSLIALDKRTGRLLATDNEQIGAGRGQGAQNQANRIAIGVDTRTNTLVVAATDAMFREVRELVQQLDVGDETVRVVTLHRTSAEAVEKASEAFGGDAVQTTNPGKSGLAAKSNNNPNSSSPPWWASRGFGGTYAGSPGGQRWMGNNRR